jgi:hypothetical protein
LIFFNEEAPNLLKQNVFKCNLVVESQEVF